MRKIIFIVYQSCTAPSNSSGWSSNQTSSAVIKVEATVENYSYTNLYNSLYFRRWILNFTDGNREMTNEAQESSLDGFLNDYKVTSDTMLI
jgi:hypothetical protein